MPFTIVDTAAPPDDKSNEEAVISVSLLAIKSMPNDCWVTRTWAVSLLSPPVRLASTSDEPESLDNDDLDDDADEASTVSSRLVGFPSKSISTKATAVPYEWSDAVDLLALCWEFVDDDRLGDVRFVLDLNDGVLWALWRLLFELVLLRLFIFDDDEFDCFVLEFDDEAAPVADEERLDGSKNGDSFS